MPKTLVIPVAGLGTRFLPATKAVPKEMLPIIDKPLIQYAVEEALEAGFEHIVFITNANKQAIETHFTDQPELEALLQTQQKSKALESIQSILRNNLRFSFIQQEQPLGLGHAILCAKDTVDDPYFAVLLPDDLIDGDKALGCLQQMVTHFQSLQSPMIAVEEVPQGQTHLYGIVKTKSAASNGLAEIQTLVEKPRENPPSNLAVVGRYLLPRTIFDVLAQMPCDIKNELQLTDAINKQVGSETYMAYPFQGKRFDCGSKLGYVKAMIHYAQNHPELAAEVREYMNTQGEYA